MKILIVNGPNLNLLGTREPEIYGTESFDSFLPRLQAAYSQVHLQYFQSNHEGMLLDFLQEHGPRAQGIVLNAGGLSHTSVALADAVTALSVPVVEVHISNVFARESFRHHSYLTPVCRGLISGFGLSSYRLALDFLLQPTF